MTISCNGALKFISLPSLEHFIDNGWSCSL